MSERRRHLSEKPKAPDPSEARRARIFSDRLHSLIVGVPVLVVLIAIGWYLHSSDQEARSPLVLEASEQVSGTYQGRSGTDRERYLWLLTEEGRRRGLRLNSLQEEALADLEKGQRLEINAAPRSDGSALWLYRITRDGQVLIDQE